MYAGETQRGIESLMPAGLANIFKTIPGIGRYQTEGGIRTSKGAPVLIDMGFNEMVGQAIGFQPSRYEEIQTTNRYKKRLDTTISDKKSEIFAKLNDAKYKGNVEKKAKALEDVLKFNNTYPGAKISGSDIDASFSSYKKRILEQDRGINIVHDIEVGRRTN